MYEVFLTASDLCGNVTKKRVGFSPVAFVLGDQGFFNLEFKEVVIEPVNVLVEQAAEMIRTGDWRG
jgi:hypothetical protein